MPQFSAPAALTLLQEKELDLPFIIVSGTVGKNTAVAAMRAGAYDYEFRIVWPDGSMRWLAGKGQVFYDETGTTAVRMIGMTMNITARKQAADQIKASG
jgi:PAS domain-containing protein